MLIFGLDKLAPDIPRPKGRGQDAVGKPAGATIGARPKFTLSTTASATGYSADLAGLDPEKLTGDSALPAL